MLFSFIVIIFVVLISGIGFNLKAWLFLPAVMIVEYVMALGAAMVTCALTVYFRDLEYILGIVMMAWMYMTPIIYSVDMIPEKLRPILNINPMTPVIVAYRDILYYKQIPELGNLMWALVLGILVLVIGIGVFNKLQKGFAEEL